MAEWTSDWDRPVPTPLAHATVSENALANRSAAGFAAINRDLVEFDTTERELLRRISRQLSDQRTTMAPARVAYASLFIIAISVIVWFAKRGVLEPLRELTVSAEKIEQGIFSSVCQTQRDDGLGVLVIPLRRWRSRSRPASVSWPRHRAAEPGAAPELPGSLQARGQGRLADPAR